MCREPINNWTTSWSSVFLKIGIRAVLELKENLNASKPSDFSQKV